VFRQCYIDLQFRTRRRLELSEDKLVPKKIALGISGGIAAYKAAEILRGLQKAGYTVRVAMTKRACEFIQPLTFRALSGSHVIVDDYAPDNPDPIAHITFSQSVDLLIVAPATANIISKFANGIADDFLTSTYLASTAPVLVAPAMNTTMWQHPATQRNLNLLREAGVHVLDPDEGEMACGTIGPGRLSDPERIVKAAVDILNSSTTSQDLVGEHLLITAGATREDLDPVRFISNRSSGRMGFALAQAARNRGAKVSVVAGITSAEVPTDITIHRVTSSDEMYDAVTRSFKDATIFLAAAAVADYKPSQKASDKIKKSETTLLLTLQRTRDILGEVAASRTQRQIIIGFAAETQDLITNARAKLSSKEVDAIVANDVSLSDSGFDSDMNTISILSRDRETPLEYNKMPKIEAANRILDEVVRLRRLQSKSLQAARVSAQSIDNASAEITPTR
jgi:phosphopantothenoylcysteine decarboxylase / phosphopantothenate---cysteine ligase